MPRLLLHITWIALLLVPGGLVASAQTEARVLTPEAQAAVDQILRTVSTGAPGAAIYLDTPSGVAATAVGEADIAAATPLQADAPFRIGSSTKMFTAVITLQLHEEGVLSLDDTLAQWVPELAASVPNGERVTLRQLLKHTSGVPSYTAMAAAAANFSPDAPGFAAGWDAAAMVALIEGESALFEPGATDSWSYSNTNYVLLGAVLEAATDQTLATLYRERIYTPLGMVNSFTPPEESGALTLGYTRVSGAGLVSTDHWNESFAGPAGAIVSTAPDMVRFLRGLANGDLFSNPATWVEMQASVPIGPELSYGLGLMMDGAVLGHNGGTPGFVSLAFYDTESDVAGILFVNSDSVPTFGVAQGPFITLVDSLDA